MLAIAVVAILCLMSTALIVLFIVMQRRSASDKSMEDESENSDKTGQERVLQDVAQNTASNDDTSKAADGVEEGDDDGEYVDDDGGQEDERAQGDDREGQGALPQGDCEECFADCQ
jgi:cytoskeletal protein RodZ